jgi:triosephosphate isomerase
MKAGRARLVAGNWKMNGSLVANRDLLNGLSSALARIANVSVGVCPPFPYLAQIAGCLDGTRIALGAQDVSEHESGAFTGEVSASMLKELGCRYVIIGHSERRQLHAESDAFVSRKFKAAQNAGLIPILCVGETLAEREHGQTEAVVGRQLKAVLHESGVQAMAGAVLAYEPVWAIGTGRNATPAQAQAVHAFLRSRLSELDEAVAAGLTILYGGSVKQANAAEIFAQPDVDGGLIGGASLIASDFAAICSAAERA